MNSWEIVAEQEKTFSGLQYRLVLLRCQNSTEPYKVYGLERVASFWDLVDKFYLAESHGTEDLNWAFEQAWPLFTTRRSELGRLNLYNFPQAHS
jgi:hypothetical protein